MRRESGTATDAAAVRAGLQHVYWLGGGSAAGKSTIARRLAADHGMHIYASDEVMADHASRSRPANAPYLERFKRMDMDERWVNRSPQTMLETFHWFRGEGFRLIVDDLLRLPAQTKVIAEGFRLLPQLVKPLLADANHAVWLVPTPQFRAAALERRGTAADIARKTSDPQTALRNLLERDRMFTNRLVEQTKRLHLQSIEVDTAINEDDLTRKVIKAFRLAAPTDRPNRPDR